LVTCWGWVAGPGNFSKSVCVQVHFWHTHVILLEATDSIV